MKKIIFILLSIICVIALAGCSGNSSSDTPPSGSPVSTVEPSYAPAESYAQEEAPQQTTSQPAPTLQSDTPAPSPEPSPVPVEPDVSEKTPQQTTPAPTSTPSPTESITLEQPKEVDTIPTVNIQVGNKNFTLTMYDNDSAQALLEKLPLTLNMDELNGNEKFYFFSERFPIDSKRVGKIKTGDLMLYGSDCLVLFYESFSTSYSYTRLGNIQDVAGLKDALGGGIVKVTFSINN